MILLSNHLNPLTLVFKHDQHINLRISTHPDPLSWLFKQQEFSVISIQRTVVQLVETCSYECRSLSWKGMACRCELLTRRCMMWGCIEVRLPQFKATPPPPEFSIVRAWIDDLSRVIMTHYKSSCVLIFNRWNLLLLMSHSVAEGNGSSIRIINFILGDEAYICS